MAMVLGSHGCRGNYLRFVPVPSCAGQTPSRWSTEPGRLPEIRLTRVGDHDAIDSHLVPGPASVHPTADQNSAPLRERGPICTRGLENTESTPVQNPPR